MPQSADEELAMTRVDHVIQSNIDELTNELTNELNHTVMSQGSCIKTNLIHSEVKHTRVLIISKLMCNTDNDGILQVLKDMTKCN